MSATGAGTPKQVIFIPRKENSMRQSGWKCPKCKQSLFVTNAARYWCSECQAEQDASHVDPMDRDYARLSIAFDSAIERGLGVSFERVT
jgi:DNA-directed RNA polymerase subunit RPC12/RpoP